MDILDILIQQMYGSNFWDWITAVTDGIVSTYGFYIFYEDFIAFIHWKDLGLICVSVLVMIFLVRSQRRGKKVDQLEDKKKELSGAMQRLNAELRCRQEEIRKLKMHLALTKDQDRVEWEVMYHRQPSYRKEETHGSSRQRTVESPEGQELKIDELREALREGREVCIDYCDEHGCWSSRQIIPLEISRRGSHVYVRAWCSLRDDERSFRIDRIITVASAERMCL